MILSAVSMIYVFYILMIVELVQDCFPPKLEMQRTAKSDGVIARVNELLKSHKNRAFKWSFRTFFS
jgi:hypothetical protein